MMVYLLQSKHYRSDFLKSQMQSHREEPVVIFSIHVTQRKNYFNLDTLITAKVGVADGHLHVYLFVI
jgi:hypothetical protein